ncbi:hypothetical protein [Haloarcula montana]|uniref:hypothetical protein n=1 Tax=Haloarcula montana TaxID=3111776 RepID=UPI002D78084C|nr:hypothetical protein [Haloarcula sp. GH36]
MSDQGDTYDVDDPGVPNGEGESWEEVSQRRTEDHIADRETLQDCIDVYGANLQSVIAVEELSELTAEIARSARYGDPLDVSPRQQLIEELADARIMLDQLTLIVGEEEVLDEREAAISRLQRRIEQAPGGDES